MKISEIIDSFNKIAATHGDVIVDNYGGISQVIEGVYRINTINIKKEASSEDELDKSIKIERQSKGKNQ